MSKKNGAKRPPSQKEEIADSGETPVDAVRAALREDGADRRFLGREFLTWLLFHADDQDGEGGRFESAEGDAFTLHLGERMVLRAVGEGAGEIAAKGPALAQTADVLYAIAGGMTVREADVLLEKGEQQFTLALSAELFDVKRAKLPALLAEDDDAKAVERLALLAELEGLLKAAFCHFLRQRLSASWEKECLPRMRAFLERSISNIADGDPRAPGGAGKAQKNGAGRAQRL